MHHVMEALRALAEESPAILVLLKREVGVQVPRLTSSPPESRCSPPGVQAGLGQDLEGSSRVCHRPAHGPCPGPMGHSRSAGSMGLGGGVVLDARSTSGRDGVRASSTGVVNGVQACGEAHSVGRSTPYACSDEVVGVDGVVGPCSHNVCLGVGRDSQPGPDPGEGGGARRHGEDPVPPDVPDLKWPSCPPHHPGQAFLDDIARWEKERRSERTRAGLRRAVAQGKHLGRSKGNRDRRKRMVKR